MKNLTNSGLFLRKMVVSVGESSSFSMICLSFVSKIY